MTINDQLASLQAMEQEIKSTFPFTTLYTSSLGLKSSINDALLILNSAKSILLVIDTWESTSPNLQYINDCLDKKSGDVYDSLVAGFSVYSKIFEQYKDKIYMCFFHECNGTGWYPWQTNLAGNNPQLLVTAYQKVINLARKLDCNYPFVQWFAATEPSDKLKITYAGDDYISWIGFSDYNGYGIWYNTWFKPGEVLGAFYSQINVVTQKPIWICECGCAPDKDRSNTKADWYKLYIYILQSGRFPNVKRCTFFNQLGSADWRINTSDLKITLSNSLNRLY